MKRRFFWGLMIVMTPVQSLEHEVAALSPVDSMPRTRVYNRCLDLCLEIWTDLDLMGAIRTSTEDLMYFADDLLDKLLDLDSILKHMRIYHEKQAYCYGELETVSDLTRRIDSRFFDIFERVSAKEVICCSVLLERSISIVDACFVTTAI